MSDGQYLSVTILETPVGDIAGGFKKLDILGGFKKLDSPGVCQKLDIYTWLYETRYIYT